MRTLEIATVGDRPEDLIGTLREFPFTKLVLLHERRHAAPARRVVEVVSLLLAEVELREVSPPLVPAVLRVVTDVCAKEGGAYDAVFANVSAGDPPACCSLVYAALVNGIETIASDGKDAMRFTTASVPFWRYLSDSKARILGGLARVGGRVESLTDLARETRLDTGALNYHLRDPVGRKGLADLGLVTLRREGNAVAAEITLVGLLAVARGKAEGRGADEKDPLEGIDFGGALAVALAEADEASAARAQGGGASLPPHAAFLFD